MSAETGVPEPSAAELADTYVMGTYARAPVTFVSGAGCHLFDDAGRSYLDFLSGSLVAHVTAQALQIHQAKRETAALDGQIASVFSALHCGL